MCFFLLVGLAGALTLLIAAAYKVMKTFPERLEAFVMKWP